MSRADSSAWLPPRCEAGASAGVDVQGRPRARAMNQLRGARPGAGVTGKPRGRAEGRGLLQFPVSLRTLGISGAHRNSPPLGPRGERTGPCRGAGPRTWGPGGKEVGEAWKGKVETENSAGRASRPRAALRTPPAGHPAGAERSQWDPAGPLVIPTYRQNPWAPGQKVFG